MNKTFVRIGDMAYAADTDDQRAAARAAMCAAGVARARVLVSELTHDGFMLTGCQDRDTGETLDAVGVVGG